MFYNKKCDPQILSKFIVIQDTYATNTLIEKNVTFTDKIKNLEQFKDDQCAFSFVPFLP